ncbi:hypothetical protein DLP05_030 [Stenotrophomonas phage vB_SmaS_DLP_5]|uniref:Uncharacterized protein n=1 Tax=Stenotrophomonas phage vB_SmaS_DLP_5 TaxID=2044561 RepID=A0A2D2W2H8_9CAUD|nr:holin [Stenotrophomonas phage vB_SmaS_DLP_5]ATS92345.1 hypothetical protein DLP05_030 [Stenotrophomonas phage vB_SmaS_DLP_5]
MNFPRITDDFASALKKGTTLPTRFWLSLSMMLYSAGFFLNQGTWLLSPTFQQMTQLAKVEYWGALYGVAGVLGMWRAISPVSRPFWAWVVNTLIFLVWVLSEIVRVWGLGWESLFSTHTGFLLMAGWCLLRTEATERDTETA